jgi:hypothetical protein
MPRSQILCELINRNVGSAANRPPDLVQQSVYSRLAGYEDLKALILPSAKATMFFSRSHTTKVGGLSVSI